MESRQRKLSILGSVGKSLNVYAVYKMRVISQNSRRKAIAEDVSFLCPRSCNCRFKIYARSLKCGYLTIGDTVCTCKSVLRVKTHASESGQMHPAICGQVIKKKVHRVSAQMYLQATVQDGVSRIHLQLLFFAAKV